MNLSNNASLTIDIALIQSWWGDPIEKPGSAPSALTAPTESPTIHATETDFVELGLALHAAGVFPNLTQESIMDRMRQLSGLPLQNWEQLGANIRRREKLTFLDRLQDSLTDRNEEIKENGRANRRPKHPQK